MTQNKSLSRTAEPQPARTAPETALDARPLYQQVRARLLSRIAHGQLKPGASLPSETELAVELGVSQGTVRKALDALTAERLLVRRQGRGTFVAEHDERRILFQFFRLVPDDGAPVFPTSRVLGVEEGRASETEREALQLGARESVIRIRRARALNGEPVVSERLTLPAALFPGLARREIPNNLYGLFATEYGVTIAGASERLKAVPLGTEDAEALGLAPGQPALLIDRVARDVEDRLVEWRLSFCRTDRHHYLAEPR